jgi:hypothetical protein
MSKKSKEKWYLIDNLRQIYLTFDTLKELKEHCKRRG